MLRFDLNLFIKGLDELETETGREERLKEIVLMVYEGRIDYDAFTFEEISEIFEHALRYDPYMQDPNNLFVQIEKPAVFAEEIFRIPRRREGHVFL